MSQLWDRREHRVDYRAVVRLKSDRHDQPVMARAGNLSRSGLLVDANQTYDIGTEVVCELPLPDEDQIHLRGRVAWVAEREPFVETEPPGGAMGIQFTDPDASGTAVVQRMVGPPRREVRKVDAWFEGVDQPVRVEALSTEDGLRLRTAIPFLRVDSAVSFVGPRGEQADSGLQAGVLRDVALRVSPDQGVPYLELRVEPGVEVQDRPSQVEQPSIAQQPAKPNPPPLPERAKRRDQLQADPADSVALSDERQDDKWLAEMEDLEIDIEEPQAADDGMELGLDAVAEPPRLHEPDTLADELGQGLPDSMASYLHEETDQLGRWSDTSELDSEFWGASAVPRRRGWIWAGALAMAVVAIASIVHTRVWERLLQSGETQAAVASSGQQAEPSQQLAVASEQAPVAQDQAQADTTQQAPTESRHLPKTESLAEKPTASPAETATGSGMSASTANPPTVPNTESDRAAASEPPTTPMASISEPPGGKPAVAKAGTSPGSAVEALQVVHNADGSTALTIPIRGSLSNLNRYPLANPDGFVVKLPHARPKIPFADYRLHDGGFRVVWVRAHEEGVQLRFLFSKPTRPHEVKVVNGRVVVTLQPPPEQLTDEEPT